MADSQLTAIWITILAMMDHTKVIWGGKEFVLRNGVKGGGVMMKGKEVEHSSGMTKRLALLRHHLR